LLKLLNEHNVKLRRFPDDVLNAFKKYAQEIIADIVSRDAMGRKIYESYMSFRRAVSSWAEVSEQVYYAKMNKI
jgi:TRAP-type mannitol/chloroaromatic compound transport system substrate-binding protein